LEQLPPVDPLAEASWMEQELPGNPLPSDPLQPTQRQFGSSNWTGQSTHQPRRRSTGNGSPTVVFVGQQLAFWSRIGTLLALFLILISLIIAFSADSPSLGKAASTLVDIARYLLIVAGVVALVGLGLFLALPVGTASWGVALASLIVCSIGGVMASLLILKEDFHSKPFVITTVLVYFAGGIMTCVFLKVLASRHRDNQAGTVAVSGIVLNSVTPAFFLLILFLGEKQFFMSPPDRPAFQRSVRPTNQQEGMQVQQELRLAQQEYIEDVQGFAKKVKWVVITISLLFIALWSISASLEMVTLGNLGQSIRDG
jgi:hypothetical protein